MQTWRAISLLLLGAFVLLLALAACESSCCQDYHPSFVSWQEEATAVARCAGDSTTYCREQISQRREVWCASNQAECCIHDPAEAELLSSTRYAVSCRPFEVAAAAAATATPVPLEAQVQAPPQQPILPPENPLPPEKVEPLVGQVVLPNVVTVTPSPTPPPKAEVIPVPPPACLAPPVLFDPPDGKNFAARNTIFRWKPGDELKPDQVYDILVSTDGGKSFKSIGTTRDTILPIDFLKWDLAGVTGNFSWTVRVKDSSGKYVSCEDKWFMMSLTDIPPAGNPAPVGPPCVPGYNVKCP